MGRKTIDYISLQRAQRLHPAIEHVAIQLMLDCEAIGIKIRLTSTMRTWDEQDVLYAQGRSSTGNIVTWAKAGESYHNYGLAIDFCLLLKDGRAVSWSRVDDNNFDGIADFMQVITIAKKLGFESGADWTKKKRDYPHLQMTLGMSIKECQNKYNSGMKDKNGFIYIT